jgi:hypothetical protein
MADATSSLFLDVGLATLSLSFLCPRDLISLEATTKKTKACLSGDVWRTLLMQYPWELSCGNRVTAEFERECGPDQLQNYVAARQLWREKYRQVCRRDRSPIIIDIGSNTTKVGYACESFPTIVHATKSLSSSTKIFDTSCSAEIWAEILNNVFDLLGVCQPSQARLCVLLRPFDLGFYENKVSFVNTIRVLKKCCFRLLNVAALRVETTPVCALFSKGLSSGVVLEVGRAFTYSCCIFEGKLLMLRHQNTMLTKYGGYHLTKLMRKMVKDKQQVECGMSDAVLMKETLTYVRAARSQWTPSKETSFILDSIPFQMQGQENAAIVQLREERYLVPESLFSPMMFEKFNLVDSRRAKHFVGVEELCRRALDSVQDDRGREIRKNLVCIGGGLDFPDLEVRLQRSLKRSNIRIAKVVRGSRRIGVPKSNENRRWIAWKGCAALLRSSEDYSKPSMISNCLKEKCGGEPGASSKDLGATGLRVSESIADGITVQDGLGVWMKKEDELR